MKRRIIIASLLASAVLAACADPAPAEPDEPEVTISYDDTYSRTEAWGLLEGGCLSNGIDPDRCECLMDAMIAAHGIDAAVYIGMSLNMHDGPAAALREQIGELRASGAGEVFETEQHAACRQGFNVVDDGEEDGENSASDSAMDEADTAAGPE